MDITPFVNWLKTNKKFDCFENDLFEKSLYAAKKEFENSTYNGVKFPDYYKDDLNNQFLRKYVSHLQLLLKSIPSQGSGLSLTIHEVCLNDYITDKERLLSLVQKLKS